MRNMRPVGIPRRCAELRADPLAVARVLAAVAALPTDRLRCMTDCYGPYDCFPDPDEVFPDGVKMIPSETVRAELRRRKIPGTRQSRREDRQRKAGRKESRS